MFLQDKTITIDKIYSYIPDYWIYEEYLNDKVEIGKTISSPFRSDKRPSMIFGKIDNKITWKDLATGDKGDSVALVSKLFNINRKQAIQKIYNELIKGKLDNKPIIIEKERKIKEKPKSKIQIRLDEFNSSDLEYWRSYNIEYKNLKEYKIKKLSSFKIIKTDKTVEIYSTKQNPIYAYCFGKRRYKIYRPFSEQYKWFSNTSVIQNNKRLSEKGDNLIITKSYKDVICLENNGFTSIAPSSESTFVSKPILSSLQKRYKNIYVLYDNDDAGIKNTLKHMENNKEFKITWLMIPDKYEVKDFSDFVKKDKTLAKEWVTSIITK